VETMKDTVLIKGMALINDQGPGDKQISMKTGEYNTRYKET